MIAIAIISVLAGIALPAYQDHIRRAALQEVQTNLSDLRIRMEQFYQSYRNYGSLPPGPGCGNVGGTQEVNFNRGGNFGYVCVLVEAGGAPSDQGYRITAQGNANTNVAGHTFTLDHNNARRTTLFRNVVEDRNCWLMRGNEC